MRRSTALLKPLALAGLLCPLAAAGHGMRTAYLELTEIGAQRYQARLKLSAIDPELEFTLPEGCVREERSRSSHVRLYLVACREPLAGQTVGLRGLGQVSSEAVVRVAWLDGRAASRVLTPASPSWTLPSEERVLSVATAYQVHGVEHIFGGADHLLFVAGLVLLVRRPRRVLLTATAFTAAHSITLSLAALRLLSVSGAAAELCVALSLVLIALDLSRVTPKTPANHGPALAFGFGLVHGLGFAGGLAEIGLPEQAIPVALAGFNVGVELGQVLFILAVLAALAVAERAGRGLALVRATTWAIGGIGCFWVLQRGAGLWG